ncbi:MAG: hypothetical protein ACE5F5_06195 [Acidimicrobiia bacterium]
MTDVSTPQVADTPATDASSDVPRVRVLLTLVEGSDLKAALAAVDRQVYEPAPEVVVVGDAGDLPEGVGSAGSIEEAIRKTDPEVGYLWLLHSDARPRPDALAALVREVERNDAGLGGSKLLVAGSHDELESVGSATDVFGTPSTGIDEGEIDLQQYDVVREVAYVHAASMLVRRDLAQGLKGLDPALPPVASGLDFSQRVRLAGGKVISVPSSEVYHQGKCREGQGWREMAGRRRAMMIAYSPLTMAWVLPYDLVISLLDSLGNLALGRGKPFIQHLLSWVWTLAHLPSTFAQRRRFRPVRSVGDEELFRFQARGSILLREVGSELANRFLSLFDEDQALVRGTKRVWASPGIWGAVVAVAVLLVAMRSVLLAGVPTVGASFPFEPPSVALGRWFSGWNDSGLGSASPVHPAVLLTGIGSWLWFGAEEGARVIFTVVFGVAAVVGMGRLAGRLGLRGPGRYLAGLVLLAGPGTAVLAGAGSWVALGAAALLPWAVRSSFLHLHDREKSPLLHLGWALFLGLLLGSISPLLLVVSPVVVVLWRLWGGDEARIHLGLVSLIGGVVAVPFLAGDPGWILDAGRRLGLVASPQWALLVALVAIPLLFVEDRIRRLAAVGSVVSLAAIAATRIPYGGPGAEEAFLVVASFGTALVVAAALDSLSVRPRRVVATVGAAALLVVSIGVIGNGRLGLPDGEVNETLAFASTLAGEGGPGRILVASTVRADIPGEARFGPGFYYRVVDGEEITLDEVWLPPPEAGDRALDAALTRIASGAELRPGELLAPFAIDWVVLSGPSFRLDDVFVAQLDLVDTPLYEELRVFENPSALPLAGTEGGLVWSRTGTGFSGDSGPSRVRLAVSYDPGWSPDPQPAEWAVEVAATQGAATYLGPVERVLWSAAAIAAAVAALTLIGLGRRRR